MSEAKEDNVVTFFVFCILFVGVLSIIWLTFRPQLAQGALWLRQGQMFVASFWIDEEKAKAEVDLKNPVVVQGLKEVIGRHRGLNDPRYFKSWKDYLDSDRYNPANFKFKDVALISKVTLEPYRVAFSVIMVLMAIIVLYYGPTSLLRQKHNIETLIETQSKVFPYVKAFVKFNPLKLPVRAPGDPVPAELGLFAEALSPEEWIAYNRIPMPDNQLDQEVAYDAFTEQLGKRWRGPAHLDKYQQIMLAAFCLKASRKREEAEVILGRLAACWDHAAGLKLSRDSSLHRDAMKILKTKNYAERTLKIMKQHAYTTPAMMRALAFARSEGGVLAPGLFVWLRGHDRNFWYPMNNLGKEGFHMEALGAAAHYKEEKRTRRPIPVPHVKGAVESLVAYMEDPLTARPVPQLDYSGIKKPKKGKAKMQEEHKKSKGILKPVGSA